MPRRGGCSSLTCSRITKRYDKTLPGHQDSLSLTLLRGPQITARFSGNSLYKYLIQGSISGFSSEKDAQEIEEFFKVCVPIRARNSFDPTHALRNRTRTSADTTWFWPSPWTGSGQGLSGSRGRPRTSSSGSRIGRNRRGVLIPPYFEWRVAYSRKISTEHRTS